MLFIVKSHVAPCRLRSGRWLHISVVFAGIAFAPIASGQSLSPKPLPREPLEKYDNPPAPPRLLQFSSRTVSRYASYTSYQVNVDNNGNNILGDAANEPSICVDPTNPNKMAIGWRQFDSVTSNFRQAGYAYTVNGGISWTFPGVLENNVFRSDPVLNADVTGRFLYLSLLQSFFITLWRSLDGGQSWSNIAPATGGDKQWFTIDNTNSSGQGFHYQAWSTDGNNYQGRQFSRSTNGGFTWMDPINIPNAPRWGTLDVDSNGNLFISGVNLNTNQIWCVRSNNAKNGAVTPSFGQSTAVNLGGNISSSQLINPVGLVGQVNLAVDRSGTVTNNNVYILASVQPDGATSGSDVMFVRSTDAGQTFIAPRRINDDPVNHAKSHWFGALAVAPNGRIDVIWLDTRYAANNTDSQLFYSYSTDGGDTWSANVAVSNSFDPFVGYPNQDKMGDYMTVVSDSTGANVAYCATFNQEEDIYYVRLIPPGNPGINPPTVRAEPVTSFGDTWAVIVGTITDNGGAPADDYYFYYWTDMNPNPTLVYGPAITVSGNTFWTTIYGLTPSTVYDYNAYAHNSSSINLGFGYGWGVSPVVSFMTAPSSLPTLDPPTITPAGGNPSRRTGVFFKICATPAATVYYTTDGSDPTTSSNIYRPCPVPRRYKGVKLNGPVRTTRCVRAIAVAPGYNNSNIAEACFTFRR